VREKKKLSREATAVKFCYNGPTVLLKRNDRQFY
jgi:hypothetical protein